MQIRNHLDFAAEARAINLLDPAAPQDAATKAYVDGLFGWKELALITPGTVNAVDLAPIDQSYNDLRLVFEAVSHSSGSNQQWTIATSANGTIFSAGANMTATIGGGATVYGALEIPGYRLDYGGMRGAFADLGSSPATAAGGALNPVWRCLGGIHGLRVTLTGSASFDGGKLRLLARL